MIKLIHQKLKIKKLFRKVKFRIKYKLLNTNKKFKNHYLVQLIQMYMILIITIQMKINKKK